MIEPGPQRPARGEPEMQTRRRPDGRTVAVLLATLMLAWATMDVVGGAVSPASGATAEPHWGPVVTLARDGQLSRPDVVVDEHGTETAAWSQAGSVVVTRRAAGGSWGPRVDLGEGSDPQLGIDWDGTVTVVWSRTLLGHGPQVMTARHPVAGRSGGWSAVVGLSP